MLHQARGTAAKIRSRIEDRPVKDPNSRLLAVPSQANLTGSYWQMNNIHRGKSQDLPKEIAPHDGKACRTVVFVLHDFQLDRARQEHFDYFRCFLNQLGWSYRFFGRLGRLQKVADHCQEMTGMLCTIANQAKALLQSRIIDPRAQMIVAQGIDSVNRIAKVMNDPAQDEFQINSVKGPERVGVRQLVEFHLQRWNG